MADERPNPDALLAKIKAEARQHARGKLKVFFGAAPGVGKTYTMLEEARRQAEQGRDVVIGYAEPHIRPDTEMLLLGLEILPYKIVEYKGTELKEFDLDAALARKPFIICIDELAHSNAPGLRHAKRYQDVQELLDAGIDVFTTLNVQHLESVNDVVERTSGIKVRETLPDWVLEQAEEVQLIDISPEKLLERIAEGKIYRQHSVDYLTRQFFNRGNLSALRELSLRRMTDRVDAQMEDFRRHNASDEVWPASDRIMVCVGPSPFSARLVRAARRMATAFKAEWIAVFVDQPGADKLSTAARQRVFETLRLAEQLGGEQTTLAQDRPAQAILAFARSRNVTRIIVGTPLRQQHRWRAWLKRSLVDELIRHAGPVDIYVIRDVAEPSPSPDRPDPRSVHLAGYGWAGAATLAIALLGIGLYHGLHLSDTNVLMIYLLGVLAVALRLGRGPAVLASMLSVGLFDFTVVPPYYSFAVSDTQYFITLAVMLITALTITTMADRLQRQSRAAHQRERQTAFLLAFSRELVLARESKTLLAVGVRHISEMFACHTVILLAATDRTLAIAAGDWPTPPDPKDLGVAQWVLEDNQPAGKTTATLPSARGLFIPLRLGQNVTGVVGLTGDSMEQFADPERTALLETFANQLAMALERIRLADEAHRAWERTETELIRNTLFSGVSHDFRTPLAVITGAATSLLDGGSTLSPSDRQDLLQTIATEADQMERLIENLLEMTRLESGGLAIKREWYPLQDILVSALQRLSRRVKTRTVNVSIPQDLPLLHVDGVLLEQVLVNLIDNALNYSPSDSPIDIKAHTQDQHVRIEVADRGPGLPPGDPEPLFEKFTRGPAAGNRRGIGLGLAICRSIVKLHSGTIRAEKRSEGGTVFIIRLPAQSQPTPPVRTEPGVVPDSV
ncbi:MAG: sensor histidine kinase KdpD [Phycisphaerae bacterium]|nr:sensor histidine kinase KdpD [Phycisphaerae bacterium]